MKNYVFHLCVGLLLWVAVLPGLARTYDITDFGARPNTLATVAIQKAIAAAAAAGGGRVLIPTGLFRSGSLFLKSHVELHLEHGAVLKGSDDLADYRVNGQLYGLISAVDAEDIALTGTGEISGNGTHFHYPDRVHTFKDYDTKYIRQGEGYMKGETGLGDGPLGHPGHDSRPGMMIVIRHSDNIRLTDLRLTDAPNWTIRLSECQFVTVSNLTILNNQLIPNSDGIHCTTSRDVTISNCHVQAGDDAIIVSGLGDESGTGGYTETVANTNFTFGNKTKRAENVTVTNCVLSSYSAGLRIGYGPNPIRNLTYSNIVMHNCNRGILIQCRDDATIEHLRFSHIIIETRLLTGVWWGKAEPISVSTLAQTGTKRIGQIRDVAFTDIQISRAEAGIVVYGADANSRIEDIRFEQVSLTLAGGPLAARYGGNFDLRPSADLATGLFKHDIPAFYARQVKNLTVRDMHVNWTDDRPAYFTEAFVCEQFEGLSIDGFSGRQAGASGSAVRLEQGRDLSLSHISAPPGTDVLLTARQVSGPSSVRLGDTANARRPTDAPGLAVLPN